jgi:hypothetical protein
VPLACDSIASIASRTNVRDDRRYAPLVRRDNAGCKPDLGFGKSEIFFTLGLDRPKQLEFSHEFSFSVTRLRYVACVAFQSTRVGCLPVGLLARFASHSI